MLYPASEFSNLDNDRLMVMARVWADEMKEVPAEAISELARRVQRNRPDNSAAYAPSVAEFQKAWQNWDYWREMNENEEAKAPVARMLPAGPDTKIGPTELACKVQMKRLASGKGMVFCQCRSQTSCKLEPTTRRTDWGTAVAFCAATLSNDLKGWICASGDRLAHWNETPSCDFFSPVDAKDAALIAELTAPRKAKTWAEIKAAQPQIVKEIPPPVVAAEGEPSLDGLPEVKAFQLDPEIAFRMFVRQCGFDKEGKGSLRAEDEPDMRLFFDWCQYQTPRVVPSRKTFTAKWEEWQRESEAAA